MPRAETSRALRAAVVRLAHARREDTDMILDALDDEQRTSVRQLLSEYRNADASESRPPHPPGQTDGFVDTTGLSPWLAERLSKNPDTAVMMTPRAVEALREAACESLPTTAGGDLGSTSLLSRLYLRAFGPRGAE